MARMTYAQANAPVALSASLRPEWSGLTAFDECRCTCDTNDGGLEGHGLARNRRVALVLYCAG
jgi:hypothetical protein